ncbi:Na/Pi cotransporter family protein [Aminicella lysinilytica]|uniref:Phosphate:Na+ symporter n=1 Tax=Aminicella lysinilytica TaxID=433323 RepID=A0A4V3CR49_9FIRM|nr:Na/Pi cotransporter family protein [Aminicella lysinilytica]TDP54382.1 phosphate:Na+ symporter [Aminicella lysinilytica]
MDIFSFITLFGGLALFLFGMNQMSASLEKLAGGKMEAILNRMTSNRFKGLLLGCGITIAIQSSSAVTVMLVGLVNSGIMDLSNTVGVIMGSNIGTTVTAWIMSMIGISSDNFFIKMLKPESFSPIMALVGVIMMMTCKTSKKRDIGNIMVGFAILMYGMQFMSNSVSPLADSPKFESILTAFNNPLLGVLTGLVVTAVIQSSAASIGMLQALSMTGGITCGMAIPIVMGQNIGTCATALISSIGVNKNAKRVAVIHILFNVIGTAVFMAVFYGLHAFIDFKFINDTISPVGIALFHTIFNVCTTALLLPFTQVLVRIAVKTIHTEPEREVAFLDERLLKTPTIAIRECNNQAVEMAHIAKNSMLKSMDILFSYSEEDSEAVHQMEGDVDIFEDHLGSYLVKLSANELSDHDTRQISKMLHTIGNFERISDHAVNVLSASKEIQEKSVVLSDTAHSELNVVAAALKEILDITIRAYDTDDIEMASRVEPLEQVIDGLTEAVKLNHINRLQKGECTIQNGFVLSDILTNYERVSDHCSNIAVAIIELAHDSFETHEYLNQLKSADDPEFKRLFEEYKNKYSI